MTLDAKFDQELTHLGTGGTATVHVDESPRELTCDIQERNSLAVSFQRVQLATSELANAVPDDLERIGNSLAGRLTYLMEPVSPIELDSEGCTLQLRSNPPQRDDDGRSYYELIVKHGGEISLTRFRKENGQPRQQVAATVTREVLLRIVNDFNSVLD